MPAKKSLRPRIKYIIGIDEVGRGPIAGPVTLCAFLIPTPHYTKTLRHFRGVKDSKQLSPTEREVWVAKIKARSAGHPIEFSVSSVSSGQIDTRGLSWAVRTAIARCLKKLDKSPAHCRLLLDGLLKAPAEYTDQKTIIGGDERKPIIALASIVAKVYRDRRLTRLAKKYPAYDFHIHKGYGTKSHYQKIALYGMCEIHRRSFLTKISS